MSWGILKYKLPDEDIEFRDARNGTAHRVALEEVDNWFRQKLKYEDQPESVRAALLDARKAIAEIRGGDRMISLWCEKPIGTRACPDSPDWDNG